MIAARSARTGQGGATLLEVLLVVAISALLIGPVSAWMLLVLREQPNQRDAMIGTATADLLRAEFPEDVSVAGAADDYQGAQAAGGRWDTWRQECAGAASSTGRPLAVLVSQAVEPVKVQYRVVTESGSGVGALWRVECEADTGVLISEKEVIDDVVDDPARTTVVCSSPTLANGNPDAPCRQIRLLVERDRGRPIELSATRRTDARSLEVDTQGNFLPAAKIRVIEQQWLGGGSQATRVTLSGADSSDPDGAPDGSDLTFRWEVPTGPEGSGAPVDNSRTGVTTQVDLPSAGDYWFRLTVTDARGASNTTYRRVAVANRNPVISLAVTPLTARAEVDTVNLDASGSTDPDGSIAAWSWALSSSDDPAQRATFSTPTVAFTLPTWSIGGLVIELTVTDNSGATAIATSFVEVLDPLAPPPDLDPGPGPGPDLDPEPVPGAPVASVQVTNGGGTSVTLDASGSQGSIVTWAWTLGLLAGTADGPVVTITYPGPGTYTARLSLTDDQGRVGRWTGQVVVPGVTPAPSNLRTVGNLLAWDPVPGARRYLVDVESVANGCARSLLNQVVSASESPSRPLGAALCTGLAASSRARVGTEGVAGGPISWSSWLDVTAAVSG